MTRHKTRPQRSQRDFTSLAEADFQPTKTAPAWPVLRMRAVCSGRSRNNGVATAFDSQHAPEG